MLRRTFAGIDLVLVVTLTASLPAQRVDVVGFVHDTAGHPVPEASVLLSPDSRIRADSVGRFVIRNLKAGLHELTVRRIGYAPFDATIHVHADGRDTIRAALTPSARQLQTVVTRSTRQCEPYKYEGLLCRKADGRGLVITGDDIYEAQPKFIADLLENTPQLRLVYGFSEGWLSRTPRPIGRCLSLLVNGQRPIAGWLKPWAEHSVERIAGIELYQPGESPPEYQFESWAGANRCILINVWTWSTVKDRLERE